MGLLVAPGQPSSLPTPAALTVSGQDNARDLGVLPPAMGRWWGVPGRLATGREPGQAAGRKLGDHVPERWRVLQPGPPVLEDATSLSGTLTLLCHHQGASPCRGRRKPQ